MTWSGLPISMGIFGDGSDGSVTISSNTTLSRDMYYENLTIDNGFALTTANFMIKVRNKLINNGTIRNNGNNASGVTGGAALSAQTIGASGAGATGDVFAGASGGSTTNSYGASGGSGGDGFLNFGGLPGTTQAPTANEGSYVHRFFPFNSTSLTVSRNKITGGGGGGAGAGDDTSMRGGGGGGGAGVIFINARTIDGTGVYQAVGGNGGAGESTGSPTGGGGGGGGGGIFITYQYLLIDPDTLESLFNVGPGFGNLGGAGGANGSNGSTGIYEIYRVTDISRNSLGEPP